MDDFLAPLSSDTLQTRRERDRYAAALDEIAARGCCHLDCGAPERCSIEWPNDHSDWCDPCIAADARDKK